MSRALPVLSLCIALLALAGALVPRDPIVVPPPPAEAPRVSDTDLELGRRIELLEDDHRALWDRVVVLERRQVAVTADAGVLSGSIVSEVAQLREEVRGVMTGEILSNDASRAALREVIREAEAESRRERTAQQQQHQAQRAAETRVKWKDFVAAAKLTFPQEQELNKRLEAEDTARRALNEQLVNGPPLPEAFRALREQRRETDQAMGKLLDDTQKEQYQALRREERGGRGPGERAAPVQPR